MSRLAKKFLRPDSVDGSKIKLLNDEALRAVNAAGNGAVSFLKVNGSDIPEFLILPVVSVDPTETNEMSRKGYVDSKAAQEAADALDSANGYTDTAISNLVNGAPALLDTLKELADALGSDENFATTISNQLSALDGRLDVIEGSDVTTGSVLWAKKQAYDYTDAEIAQEVIDRNAAISVAQTALEVLIDTEELAREDADANEQQARMDADDVLDGRLDIIEGSDSVEGSVAKAEKDAKDYADSLMATEEQAREAADAAIDGRLDVLEADPTTKTYVDAADADLQGQINDLETLSGSGLQDEIDARVAADEALDGRLDVLEGDNSVVGSVAKAQADAQSYTDSAVSALVNGAPALLDTLKELADALGSDENFAVTVGNQISALDTRLDVIEGSDVTSGSVLWAKKQAADYTDAEIAQEVIDRDAAILVEAGLRSDADDALDARLDIIEGADTVAGSVAKALKDANDYTDSEVATEAGLRSSGDDALDARLDVLEGADSVEGSVAKAEKDAKDYADSIVATEQSAREAADQDLQDQVDTHDSEITDLQSQVGSLNSGTFHKQKKVLVSGDVSNQYVNLTYEAKANSTMVFISGGAGGYMHEGDDYTVSVVSTIPGPVSRITFAGDFATGGSTALEAGDVMYFQFSYVP